MSKINLNLPLFLAPWPRALAGTALAALALTTLGPSGCLPADTRPEPGSVASVVVAEDAIHTGFRTSDDWEVSFDEFLISLGEVEIEGDDCNPYAESDYARILDMRQPGAQRLNLMHALGSCEYSFIFEDPDRDAVLGTGVDEADKQLMRTAGSDQFVRDRGVALYVSGGATRDQERYSFEWSFRPSLAYTDCGEVQFDAGASDEVEIQVRGSVLFQMDLEEGSPLHFDGFASADVDGDHDITLEELDSVGLIDDGNSSTLAEFVYLRLLPQVPRFRNTDACRFGPPEDDF